jgi:hypothetical protein
MRKTILAIMLALALVLIPVGSAFAAPVPVTVTATPVFLSFTAKADDAGTDWPINDLMTTPVPPEGDGLIRPATTYYSNPTADMTPPTPTGVKATECWFTFDNDSNVAIDITCKMSDFVTGGMTNTELGYADTVGAGKFGASGYVSGAAFAAVIFPRDTESAKFIDNLPKDVGSDTIKWGIALLTQSDDFASATPTVSTVTCTALEHS